MKNLRPLLQRVRPQTTGGHPRSRRRSQLARRLFSETLESRQLLAGDVGETVVDDGPSAPSYAMAHNYGNKYDVNNDRSVSALDALTVINHINRRPVAGEMIVDQAQFEAYVDVNGDHRVTALDALQIINAINAGAGEDANDEVEFVLRARDNETDELLSNVQGVTDVTPDDSTVIEYNVDEGEIFRIEVAVQDARPLSEAVGIFRIINDIVISQSDVIEPALGEFQQIVFENEILDITGDDTGTFSIGFADDPTNTTVSRPLSDLTSVIKPQRDALVETMVVELFDALDRPGVEDVDDIRVSVDLETQAPGPNGNSTGALIVSVLYTSPELVNQNVGQLQGSVVINGAVQEVENRSQEIFVGGEVNPLNLVSNFNYENNEASFPNLPFQIYGGDRGVGEYTPDVVVDGNTVDVFSGVGALGPTTQLQQFFQLSGRFFDPSVAYDAYSIPVRAVASTAAEDPVLVRLDTVSADRDAEGVLKYGTDSGKESVAIEDIALDETSRFLLNVNAVASGISTPNQTVTGDEDTNLEIELSSIVVPTTVGETITYSLGPGNVTNGSVNLPNGSVAIDNDGTVTFTPDPNYFGDANTITYTAENATDGSSTGTLTFDVEPVNDRPVAVDDGTVAVPLAGEAGQAQGIAVLANDNAGPGPTPGTFENDVLTIESVDVPAGVGNAVIDGTNVIFTPANDASGLVTFTYTVNDGSGAANATATATVRVNVTPSTQPVSFATQEVEVDEDDDPQVVIADLNAFITTIPAGSAVTFSNVNATSGVASLGGLDNSELSYEPADDEFGDNAATITFTATTAEGSTTGTVIVDIEAVNDPPVGGDNTFSVPEGAATNLNVLNNATTGAANEVQTLSIADVTQPPAGEGSVRVVTVDGVDQIEFTAPDDSDGLDTDFTYELSDGVDTTTVSVSVTVTQVIDQPVANNGSFSVIEDGSQMFDLESITDSDPDEATSYTITMNPSVGTLTPDGTTGMVTYTPPTDFDQSVTFEYQASNSAGSTTATVTVNVTPVNDPPVAAMGLTATTSEETPIEVDVVTPGSDVEGDTLTPVIITGPAAAQGTASIVGNAIRFVPAAGFVNDSVQIEYQLDDGGPAGTNRSETETLTINVTDVVVAPVANNGSFSVDEDGSMNFDLETITDSDPAETTSYAITANPASGMLTQTGTTGAITFTPAADFFGPLTFTYQASNSSGSTSAVVTINVTSINDPPTLVNDTATVVRDGSVLIDVLSNDSFGPANEAQTLSITNISTPSQGTAVPSGGQILYTPP
ncbi:MAG: Ig-like domain-containing protein, partial [Planctomycetota bacterium]